VTHVLATPTGDDRADDVLDAIRTWNEKVPQQDRQTKYCKMASAPLVFYRGTNHLFWAKFADDQRLSCFGSPETRTWLQGDLHAYNFGAYHNNKDEIVYDLNDFDEAIIADYQYDLWRMAVSLVLIARQNGDLSARQQGKVIDAFVESYLYTLKAYRNKKRADKIYFTQKNTAGKLHDFLKSVEKTYNYKGMLKRWAPKKKNGKRRLKKPDKLSKVSPEERDMILEAMVSYRKRLNDSLAKDKDYFKVKAVAHRLQAGTGSLGTPRYYVLIEGTKSGTHDDRILDVKLQSRPTAYTYLGKQAQNEYDAQFEHEAHRHAEAYRALTRHTDRHLGWMILDDGSYSVRERSPYKEAFPGEALDTRTSFSKLAEQWAEILATDHTRANKALPEQIYQRTNKRYPAFRDLVREVAFEYAREVEADWRSFVAALEIDLDACGKQAFTLPSYKNLLPR